MKKIYDFETDHADTLLIRSLCLFRFCTLPLQISNLNYHSDYIPVLVTHDHPLEGQIRKWSFLSSTKCRFNKELCCHGYQDMMTDFTTSVSGPHIPSTHSRRADPRRQARPRTRCRGRGWRRSCAGQGPVPDEAELPCPGGACWDSLRGLRDT